MTLINKILEMQEFATLPPVAAKILKLLDAEDVDIRNISSVIENDAPLTLKLIRVANSPIYAVRNEITSIRQAIMILGLNRLINIVLGVSIFSRFLLHTQTQSAEFLKKFWWHSSSTGIIAKSLSERLNVSFKENEFIGGLLHDIGKLAMFQYDSLLYAQVVNLINELKISDVEAEEQVFGVNHLEVGEKVAKLWKLPEDLTQIIASHSLDLSKTENPEIIAIVRLADILCEIWGADFHEGIFSVNMEDEECWKILSKSFNDLKKIDIPSFTFELENEYKKSAMFLSLLSEDNK